MKINEKQTEAAKRQPTESVWSSLDKSFVWHPFTQMEQWNQSKPLVIESGKGNYLFDTEGNRYFDGVSSLWTNVHGHNHPKINQAIINQAEQIAHCTLLGLASPPSIALAQRLVDITPTGLSKVFYSDSGSSAVEIAIKMAFQYWKNRGQTQKTKFVSLKNAYHGDTLGAVSVGGIDLFHEVFSPLLFSGFSVTPPYLYRDPLGGTEQECCNRAVLELHELLETNHQSIAAMIVEPLVQGAAGMLTYASDYLRKVSELCKEFEVLLIVDEVATGFGRTGTMFACEHEKIHPDLVCLAKGITGGYLPLAATLVTDEIYAMFLADPSEDKQFFHGHTYTGNALAAAAALASIQIFEDDDVITNLAPKIQLIDKELTEKIKPLSFVGDIRQCGMMVGIELVRDKEKAISFACDELIGAQVCHKARDYGVILRPLGDVIVLMPPLSSTKDELVSLIDTVASSILDITGSM